MGSYLESIPVSATEDMSGAQYHAVDVDGTLAQAVGTAIGVLQNKPQNGEDGTAGYSGRSRYRAGGAVTAGNRLTVTTSGWFTVAASGDDFIGRAIGTVGSGGIGEGIFNFASGQA